MLNAEFYNFTQQVQGALYGALFASQNRLSQPLPALPPLMQVRGGYAESPGWFMVQASEFDPEPLTVANLRVRAIYASERIVAALLELLAGERWLQRQGEAYHLTPAGRDLLATMRQRARLLLDVMEPPLPQADMARLESLLGRIINASLQAATPPGLWCLAHSRNRAPADDAPLFLRINHYFSDLNAFRDDAHMAAWQALGISGHAWEALALIGAGQAASAAAVYDKLPFRGYAEEEYAAALQMLVQRGWLAVSGDAHAITTAGAQVRADAETCTDAYFYAPWSTLTQEEVDEVRQLLEQIQAAVAAGSLGAEA
ncbi:MAG: hypothetical protein R3A44_07700 [Caldilineaceae bacterium]